MLPPRGARCHVRLRACRRNAQQPLRLTRLPRRPRAELLRSTLSQGVSIDEPSLFVRRCLSLCAGPQNSPSPPRTTRPPRLAKTHPAPHPHRLPAQLVSDHRAVDAAFDRIPSALRDALFPFQRDGVKFALRRRGRCLVGDEMGLGKTIQAIALLAAYRDAWPALVLCPPSLRDSWVDELERWLGVFLGNEVRVVSSKQHAEAEIRAAQVLVCPYSMLTNHAEALLARQFRVCVADESHMLKDFKTQRTKAAQPILRAARHCVLLTGTPALSRPSELFTQARARAASRAPPRRPCLQAQLSPAGAPTPSLPNIYVVLRTAKTRAQVQLVQPELFPRPKEFADRFCPPPNKWGNFPNGCQNADELHSVLNSALMVRRLKKDVLTQLPAKARGPPRRVRSEERRTLLLLTAGSPPPLGAAAAGAQMRKRVFLNWGQPSREILRIKEELEARAATPRLPA